MVAVDEVLTAGADTAGLASLRHVAGRAGEDDAPDPQSTARPYAVPLGTAQPIQ